MGTTAGEEMITGNYDPRDDTSSPANYYLPAQCSSTIAWGSDALRCGKEEGHTGMHRRKGGGMSWSNPECQVCESEVHLYCPACEKLVGFDE